MDKIGIVGAGFTPKIVVINEVESNKTEIYAQLCEQLGYSTEQIEVVSKEDLVLRAKELEQPYIITQYPDAPPVPDIYMEDPMYGVNKHKLRSYTRSDEMAYQKKIVKRRKKNKNKKTHRK